MFRFKIEDWYDIHNGFTLSITHPYTALAGPNGAGKTTLLHQISETARRRKIPVFRYSDVADGRTVAKDNATFWGDVRVTALLIMSSEGEQLRMNFFAKLEKLKTKLSRSPDSPSFLLVDALDSGSSIDAQRFIRGELEKLRPILTRILSFTATGDSNTQAGPFTTSWSRPVWYRACPV